MKNSLNYKGTYVYIGIVRKQVRILVCITEPLLCYMNSECVLKCRDIPKAGNNLIPISVPFYCS